MAEQGTTYAAFIEAELKLEYERRTALDARGLAIVTSSSAVITLLLAVAGVFLGKDFKLAPTAKGAVIVSLFLFLIAALFGLLANRARLYELTHTDTLTEMTQGHWTDDEADARNVCCTRNVITLKSLRRGNNDKSDQVMVGFVMQLTAIAALAFALGSTVLYPPDKECPTKAKTSATEPVDDDCAAVEPPA